MNRFLRGMATLLVFAAIFAAATWGVVTLLGSRGIIHTNSCTAYLPDGSSYALTAEQADNAALITAIAAQRQLPARAATIALATARQESRLENIDYGDRDSVGLFQQRPSQGWGTVEQIMDPVYSTGAFYDALVKVPGYEDMEITEAAQIVQISAHPEAYSQHENMARAFASALSGHSHAALTCDLAEIDQPDGDPLQSVMARLERDFGSASGTVQDSVLTIDATAILPHVSAETAAWSVGQWAVATASVTEVTGVRVGDQEWTRGTREWVTAATPAAAGTVLVW